MKKTICIACGYQYDLNEAEECPNCYEEDYDENEEDDNHLDYDGTLGEIMGIAVNDAKAGDFVKFQTKGVFTISGCL